MWRAAAGDGELRRLPCRCTSGLRHPRLRHPRQVRKSRRSRSQSRCPRWQPASVCNVKTRNGGSGAYVRVRCRRQLRDRARIRHTCEQVSAPKPAAAIAVAAPAVPWPCQMCANPKLRKRHTCPEGVWRLRQKEEAADRRKKKTAAAPPTPTGTETATATTTAMAVLSPAPKPKRTNPELAPPPSAWDPEPAAPSGPPPDRPPPKAKPKARPKQQAGTSSIAGVGLPYVLQVPRAPACPCVPLYALAPRYDPIRRIPTGSFVGPERRGPPALTPQKTPL